MPPVPPAPPTKTTATGDATIPSITADHTLHEAPVADAFATSAHDRILTSLRDLEAMGFHGDADVIHALSRKRLSAIDQTNPATRELIARVPGVEHWLALVPTPRALSPLYDPSARALPGGHVIGDELRRWMVAIADARGLRHRAQMVTDLLTRRPSASGPSTPPRWLSVASGAAQPVLRAADAVRDRTGQTPEMTLVDLSPQALRDAWDLAARLRLADRLRLMRRNVLDRRGLDVRAGLGASALQWLAAPDPTVPLSRAALDRDGYDVVEAVGILEYVNPDDWSYRHRGVAGLRTTQAGARTFLRAMFRLVKPGGDLIVGNMLDAHPQLGFTLNVIQWPHIQPRSIEQMMRLIDAAGLDAERHVYVPSDADNRVYALYRLHKPA
ncbi:hypothetical protein [Xylanimonas ulmi]|uniref:Methyltransferase family protein n=1 Tax=Xylanimonas ulmi TaxID=228973 RepID=A0A4Q7M502_9MICO|nr:hypothetical protein [Xylanibacterium ulmi]RZS61638.1 hypothetical protein EV386_1947 [Xylanibacterium ulmi]